MKLMIAIPTYKRPELLHDLVAKLNVCALNAGLSFKIYVFDNDESCSAEVVVGELKSTNVVYVSFPVKGLSNVRNKILSYFSEGDFDYLMMIDDDQIIGDNFFANLLNSRVCDKYDVVSSQVSPLFVGSRPTWTLNNSIYWSAKTRKSGEVSIIYGAGCVIFNSKIKNCTVRFCDFFNSLGGEDTAFFVELNKVGFSFFIADFLETLEIVDEKRAAYEWFLKRAIRIGVSEYFLNKIIIKKSTVSQITKSCVAVVIFSPLFLLHLLLKVSFLNAYAISFLRHLGRIVAALGRQKNAY